MYNLYKIQNAKISINNESTSAKIGVKKGARCHHYYLTVI